MKAQNYPLLEEMITGDVNAFIHGLTSTSVLDRMNAIIEVVHNKCLNMVVINLLKALKEDKSRMFGRSIGEYATAALHLLGVEKYSGINTATKELIESQFLF